MEPFMLFLTLSAAILFIFISWFLLCADCDLPLTFNTKFGRSVSVFKGKVVWITGASSGLGEAMAYELASVGARLILSARNTERLEKVKKKCLGISQGKLDREDILVLPFDITECDVHENKFRVALDHFHQIDVLINCAGAMQIGSSEKTSIDVDRDLFNSNYFGPVNLTKVLLSYFKERRKGQIVCIASLLGKCGFPGMASYSATKHALLGFYDSVRIEHMINNIQVTVVCPGLFKSDMVNRVMTETKGEIHKDIITDEVEMTTSRCAHLSLIAIANNSNECWMSYQPSLLLPYMDHYMPDRGFFCSKIFCTKYFVSECVHGRYPKTIRTWKPLFS